jgi:hypothetical protein
MKTPRRSCSGGLPVTARPSSLTRTSDTKYEFHRSFVAVQPSVAHLACVMHSTGDVCRRLRLGLLPRRERLPGLAHFASRLGLIVPGLPIATVPERLHGRQLRDPDGQLPEHRLLLCALAGRTPREVTHHFTFLFRSRFLCLDLIAILGCGCVSGTSLTLISPTSAWTRRSPRSTWTGQCSQF